MPDGTAVARQRIAEQAATRRVPVDLAAQETAAALLYDWWRAAERHGITDVHLHFVTSLPAVALDAVLFAERQALIRGWSR